jgi:hypothetical protein
MKNFSNRRVAPVCIVAAGFFAAANLSQATYIDTNCSEDSDTICWEDSAGAAPLDFLYESYRTGTTADWSYSGTWDITDSGFDSATHTINAITVWFSFADDSSWDDQEFVDISVGGNKYWNDLEVDGNHSNPPSSYDTYIKSFDLNADSGIFSDLQSDGKLSYSVFIQDLLSDSQYDREDTYLKVAKIEACGTPNRVPDSGSTFLAFGLGLLGLGGVRRFLIKA